MAEFIPHPYQRKAYDAIIANDGTACWFEMGLGKTATTLMAINEILYNRMDASRVLVVAPKKVAEATWQDEAAKWDNLRHLTFCTLLGTQKQRLAALEQCADIYVINREKIPWLVQHYGRAWPFDMVVLDEASSFKSHSSQRFKSLRRVRGRIYKIVELTGTPAPKDYLDLWSQIYLLDEGERLGRTYTAFREKYFTPDRRNGMTIFSWKPKPGAEEEIQAAISDIVLSAKAADHIELPDMIVEDIPVQLDEDAATAYRTMELQMLLEVDGETITAMQAAALSNKLLQLCNGAVYDTAHEAHTTNTSKLESLSETINALDGLSALVFYEFESDKDRILRWLQTRHRGLRIAVMDTADDQRRWNAGEIDVLLAHPASCAYGLNLQQGGHHIVWFGLPWNLEWYLQANARLHRQGQRQPVIVHRLLVKGGEDERVAAALERKDTSQASLMESMKIRIKQAHEREKTG